MQRMGFFGRLEWLALVLGGITALAVGAPLALIIANEMLTNRLVVEKFSVPKEMNESGLSGEYAAKSIVHHIRRFQEAARLDSGLTDLTAKGQEVDLELEIKPIHSVDVAISDFSIVNLTSVVKGIVCDADPRVSAYVRRMNDRCDNEPCYQLRYTIEDTEIHAEKVEKFRLDEIENVLLVAAKRILGHVDPIALVAYLHYSEKLTELDKAELQFYRESTAKKLNGRNRIFGNHMLGILDFRSGNYQASINSYSRAIELGPEFARSYANRALAHWRLGNKEAAEFDFEKAIELALTVQEKSAYLVNYAGTLAEDGDNIQKAIDLFERAVEEDPQNHNAHFGLAFTYTSISEHTLAIESYTKAIDTYTGSSDTTLGHLLGNRCWEYYKIGKLADALLDCEAAVQTFPNQQNIIHSYGKVLEEAGDRKAAMSQYELACDLSRASNEENPTYCDDYERISDRFER